MKIYAVYRCLYGEDFVKESILSISDYVDKIFIFWTNIPWGNVTECTYKGEVVKFPERFDNILKKINELKNPKIILIQQVPEMNYLNVPWNLYTTIINKWVIMDYERPDIVVIPEVDHVFRSDQAKMAFEEFISSNLVSAKTRQVELWKTPLYRIPERPKRIGVVFWNLKLIDRLPVTLGNGEDHSTRAMNSFVHNLGFVVSKKVMYWKHMTAIAFSEKIRDSIPDENWLDRWLTWNYKKNNRDLEVSINYKSNIPYAYPYDKNELPELIRQKYNL